MSQCVSKSVREISREVQRFMLILKMEQLNVIKYSLRDH